MKNENYHTAILDQLPGFLFVKNLQLQYTYVNTNTALLAGFKHPDDMLGVTDFDLKCPASENAEAFAKQDKHLLKTQQAQQLICLDHYSDNSFKALIATKKPLRNDAGEITGIICHALEADLTDLLGTIIKANDRYSGREPITFEVQQEYHGMNLTRRESECLFHALRGKSCKDIGAVLNLSSRTIEDYIEKIKSKMGCFSKKELLDKSYELGYLYVLPMSVFQTPNRQTS